MEYAERLAEAKILQAIPPKKDLPQQKFKRGQKIKVCDKMPSFMSHFESGFEAIVEYSYAQKFGGDDVKSYSLCQLKDGRIVNKIAWYDEEQLTLLDKDTEKGFALLGQYYY